MISMKKNGFTLIEIIGVLVIISLLLIIILPNILNKFYGNKDEYSEVNEKLIIEAARVYVESNPDLFLKNKTGKNYCILINDLVLSGNLDEDNITLTQDYKNAFVEAYYNGSYFELVLKNDCQE